MGHLLNQNPMSPLPQPFPNSKTSTAVMAPTTTTSTTASTAAQQEPCKPLDPMYNKEPSLSQAGGMIEQLLAGDNMMNTITAQRFKLLYGSNDLTYTMCALSDDIVAHLAQWMKSLPFYQYLPMKQCSDLLSSSWGAMLLFTTSLNKAWSLNKASGASSDSLNTSSTGSDSNPSRLPIIPKEERMDNDSANGAGALSTGTDGDDSDVDPTAAYDINSTGSSEQRAQFYELLRTNMKSLHSHVMAALQREVKFGEVYDAMGVMTDRITHIVHKMSQLHITRDEMACLKVILLLLQGKLAFT